MKDFKFRQWLEANIFGFEDNESSDRQHFHHPAKKPFKGPQDLPIERLNVQRVVEELAKNDLGIKKGVISFFSECQWGTNPGAIKAIITPKINVKIQRLHHDLEGNKVWLMKKFFFIDDANFAGKEDVVALEIFDQVKKINDEGLEKPSKNIALGELTQALSSKMNTLESHSLVPGHQVKRVSENEYNLYYYLRGGGRTGYAGASTTKNIMEVVVSLSSHKSTGLIKGMVTVVSNIDSGAKGGGSWVLIPSDFVEYFMPSQGKKEIVESIMTALRSY